MKKSIFNAVVNHLWDHRYYYNNASEFDYPWYAGIPKKYSRYLSHESVDAIQSLWEKIIEKDFYTSKRTFVEDLRFELEYLGEKIT